MNTTVQDLELRHPLRRTTLAHGTLAWREAGDGPALVLLHGIGSGSLAWAAQLDAFAGTHRVLAWDAPGYGESAPLASPQPLAPDYAEVLAEWLATLGVRECAVVGHSLGALVAAAFAAQAAERHGIALRALLLASPALGYGDRPEAERAARWKERADLAQRLGPVAMAAERAPRLCTDGADAASVALVASNMARVTPGGYAQAAHLLAFETLAAHAARARCPIHVLCGTLDRITPAAASSAFAQALGAPFHAIPGAAHACYVEHAPAFNAEIGTILESTGQEAAHHG